MPSALVVGTNTYVSLADATTYLDDSINSTAWAFLDPDSQTRALISSFRILEKQRWQGSKTDPLQTAEWPRTGVVDCEGTAVDSAVVPDDIVSAQIELAYYLSQNPTFEADGTTGSNIRSLHAGAASIDYFSPNDLTSGNAASRFPANIQELIRCFVGGSSTGGATAFGTSCPETFDTDGYDRTLPF